MAQDDDEIKNELERLDPSDSMLKAIEVIGRALDEVELRRDDDGAILDLIDLKVRETMEYYLRPLDDDPIYNRLISLSEEKGNGERVDRYRRALDIRQARRWILLADSQAVVGNNTLALQFYKRALFFGPTEDVIEEVRSAALRSEKRVEKALKEIDRSLGRLRSDPGSKKIGLECAKYLSDLDRLKEAEGIVEDQLKGSKEDFDLLYLKGCILFSTGDHKGACGIFEKLTVIKPDSLNARRCHNWSVQMMGMEGPNVS